MKDETYAVIPAAGRGARLGLDLPKILVPLASGETVWSVLRRKLLRHVDKIHVVLSPQGRVLFEKVLEDDPDRDRITTSVQQQPKGMGDAIWSGYPYWRASGTIIIVWGDQVLVSDATISAALELHRDGVGERCVIPLVALDAPYVQYIFEEDKLVEVRQSREGDVCDDNGFGDVGTFVLSVAGYAAVWEEYLQQASQGAQTGEINFLPFLSFLSRQGWSVHPLVIKNPDEARGINTPDDLDFAIRTLAHQSP
jgi:bifunctional UDP-N-acetylglucosamine pyrophosphorylase/glucosamine-1-phosphate N-acetyltransferase